MKCIILAGGKGERLWPLSRQDFPKQFIQIQRNHSIFQETVARNMAYCDEFIVVTNHDYRFIVNEQMQVFQGVSYRCVFEEIPRHTTAAVILACMELQPSEYVFVTSASHLIDTGECSGVSYRDAMLRAKEVAGEGKIALFGRQAEDLSERYGYYVREDRSFIEKPAQSVIGELKQKEVYQNLGILLFQNGTFLNEVKKLQNDIWLGCREAFSHRRNDSDGIFYSKDTLAGIRAISIEHGIIEPTDIKELIKIDFGWNDISRLEDLEKTDISTGGVGIINEGEECTIINRTDDKTVVINGLDDVIAVNTADAVYIGKKGESYKLRDIIREHNELRPYTGHSETVYRSWGHYVDLSVGQGYRVRMATVRPGKTIYEHAHEHRLENWTIISGIARITLDGRTEIYEAGDAVSAAPGTSHQISNTGDTVLVFIETSTGELVSDTDMKSQPKPDISELGLGMKPESVIKLSPAYKDYLWGGSRLRDVYGKQCDYDVIAESWELSAHPAGNSKVASGRHRGMAFGRYLEVTGREALGWKCAHLEAFPILIKFIDAKQNLSVQVHPDDEYAMLNEKEYGKNEMWYVIDSEPGAGLYVGFSQDVSREEVEERIKNNTIMEVLNFYPTSPGDVFFIPAGTVHAIGAGNLICEIQQSSNSTYRLYDYDRRDKFGNPRELHLAKALDVLDYNKYHPAETGLSETSESEKTIRCKYFETMIQEINGEKRIGLEEDSFRSVICIKGAGTVTIKDTAIDINAGDSIFIPADKETIVFEGKMSVVITGV